MSAAGAIAPTHVSAVLAYLEGAKVHYELVEHEPTASAAAEARSAHLLPERTAKPVFLHDGDAYVVAVVTAADRLDLHKLRELLGASRKLRLASEQEIERDFPTLEVGAVPPFGPMLPAAEVIDSAVAAQRLVLCPAGDHRHSVLVDPRDLVRITAARVAEIADV
jgi:Ala-tRNA(Pro) deacylase